MSDDPRQDAYLWDPAAPRDPDVVRLEQALASLRFDPARLDVEALLRRADAAPEVGSVTPSPAPQPSRGARVPALLGALLAAAAALLLVLRTGQDPLRGWSLRDDGARLVERTGAAAGGALLEVGPAGSRLEHPELGHLDLEPGTRLALVRSDPGTHRFELLEGALHAEVVAEPRVFQVGSPAGLTVDLGCEYRLRVVDEARVELQVLTGQVAFTQGGREVYVPAGASCTSTVDRGPTPPLFDDARAELRDLVLAAHDGSLFEGKLAYASKELLDVRDREEALPLFALLCDPAVDEGLRRSILARLGSLFRMPPEVDPEALLRGDALARDLWLEDLRPWWRRAPASPR